MYDTSGAVTTLDPLHHDLTPPCGNSREQSFRNSSQTACCEVGGRGWREAILLAAVSVSSWTSSPLSLFPATNISQIKSPGRPALPGAISQNPTAWDLFSCSGWNVWRGSLGHRPLGYFCICGTAVYTILEGIGRRERDHQRKYIEDEMFESGFTLHFRDQLSTKNWKSGLGLSYDNYQSLNDNRFSFIEENIKKCQHSLVFWEFQLPRDHCKVSSN